MARAFYVLDYGFRLSVYPVASAMAVVHDVVTLIVPVMSVPNTDSDMGICRICLWRRNYAGKHEQCR